MASCDILDFRCIFVNEIVGGAFLTVLFLALLYFIIAGKLRWGFDTTIALIFPILLLGGLMITGFSAIFAFSTVIVGIMLAWVVNEIIRNR